MAVERLDGVISMLTVVEDDTTISLAGPRAAHCYMPHLQRHSTLASRNLAIEAHHHHQKKKISLVSKWDGYGLRLFIGPN